MNNKWFKLSTALLILMFLEVGVSQASGYLTQKLMVENNLRERISSALSKIIDESQYVVDVSVELEISDAVEEQITYFSGKKQSSSVSIKEEKKEGHISPKLKKSETVSPSSESMVGLPIPGFEFEVEKEPSREVKTNKETTTLSDKKTVYEKNKEETPNILSKTSSHRRPSTAKIVKQEISIILQEGSSPELIENVRQLVMMASKFKRSRGDAFNIITASFKERRGEKSAEQVLLKAIAEKIESLEAERIQTDKDTEIYGKKDAEDYKKTIQELEVFVDSVKSEAKKRLNIQEIERAVAPHKAKIEQLQEDLLKFQAVARSISGAQADSGIEEKERQLKEAETRIDEISELLERTKGEMESTESGGISNTILLMALMGGFFLIILLAIFFSLQSKTRTQYPPPWMYPPRRPKKKKNKKKEQEELSENTGNRGAEHIGPGRRTRVDVEEDKGVVRSEINDIKKSVVSMSVGQPGTATKIVKEWMEDEVVPELEPEVEEEISQEKSDKKSKKKKK